MILVDCALVRVVYTFFFIIISITATNLFARLFYLSHLRVEAKLVKMSGLLLFSLAGRET